MGRSFFFSMRCTLPYWSRMASTGHTGPQAPQSMHRSGTMMWRALRSPLIASVGQRLVQAVQPMQVSMIRNAIRTSPGLCIMAPRGGGTRRPLFELGGRLRQRLVPGRVDRGHCEVVVVADDAGEIEVVCTAQPVSRLP